MAHAVVTRIVSAVVLAVPVLAAVHMGSPLFDLLILIAAIILASEWYRMCASDAPRAGEIVLGVSLLAAIVAMSLHRPAISLGLLVAGIVAVFAVSKGHRWLSAGAVYIGLPCVALIWLRSDPQAGRQTIYWLLGLVWATDIGAYFSGRAIGGPKLAPRISPGKTWAGLIGGIACAGLVGIVVAAVLDLKGIWLLALISGVLGGLSQAGDLFESWIKRRFGAKDSGTLIPGHGGLLDRVDALIAVVVVTAMVSTFAKGSILQCL